MGKNKRSLTKQITPDNALGYYPIINRNGIMDAMLSYDGTEDVDYNTLHRMYKDSDIERFVFMKASLCASMIHGYKHPNKEIEKFVWDTLLGAEGSFYLTMADALADCTVYGHHFSEIVWKRLDNGRYGVKRYVYIEPNERHVVFNKNYDIKEIEDPNGRIKKNKLLYLNFMPNRGIWGKSEIASLYPYFLLQRTSLYNYGKTLERFGFPWAIGKTSDTDNMLSTLKNMYNIASAAIDIEEEIDLVEPQNKGEVFDYALDIALRAYLRKLGIPELMVNVKNSGTYNLGEVQFNWFIDENEDNTRNKSEELVQAFVKPIIDINFGEQEGYGEFVILKSPNSESMKQYASILQILTQGNSINDDIRLKVFERMGMLEKDIGKDFEKIMKGGADGGQNSSNGDGDTKDSK